MYQTLSLGKRFSVYETMGALFRSDYDRLEILTLRNWRLEEVKLILEVMSDEAGID